MLLLLLLAVPVFFLLLFFYYPLGSVLVGGLSDRQGRFSLGILLTLLADPYYLKIIGFTVWQAILSTLLSVLMGLPGAYLLARYDFRGKRLIQALTTVPFVLPSIIVVLGFVRFFGNNGILNRFLMALFGLEEPPLRILYSLQAILLAHAFYNFPIVVRVVSSLWQRIHPSTEEAARSLGAHGLRLFWRVTLPQILPAVLSAAALVFIFCLLSFAIVLVLGGGPRYTTLEVEVYRLAKVSLDLKTGSALALIGALISLLFLYVYIKLQQRSSFAEQISEDYERPRLASTLGSARGAFHVVYLLLMAVVILAPMATVVAYSFQVRTGWGQQAISLGWYRRIFSGGGPYLRAVANSLFFAVATMLLSLPLGTLLAYLGARGRFAGSRLLEAITMLPIGISSIILGLGYLKAYQQLPWKMVGSWYAIVFAHTVIAYPFVIRVASATFRKMKSSLSEAARSLGAGPWRLFWHLELPLARSALITGAAFAFGISVGEINASLMLYNEKLITIPVMIYRLIGSYNFIGACAMGSVLMLFCFLAFLIIDRAGGEVG
ncbi:MAG: iron ABC transporter permease [Spirochaetaceae bacterium]|nr:MAG: iron ABC transporter permease [Spirochaetaceae bacterium]